MSDPVDAIVLDYDSGEFLDALLRSMAAQTVPFHRVIVWDNGSSVPTSDRIGEYDLPIVIHRVKRNLGFTGGINAAMQLVEAPLVAWINSDVRLEPRWMERVSGAFGESVVVAAQAINVMPEGRIDGAGIAIDDGTYRQFARGGRPEDLVASGRQPWGISATAAMYRSRVLRDRSLAGFVLHPSFFLYYEDVELCARLREAGFRFALVPEALAVHEGSKSAHREPAADVLRVRNRYWVNRLHPGVGRKSALIMEDLRRIAGAVARLRLRDVRVIVAGMRAGMGSRIE